ncbi:Predicted transcriptional regulator YdeE, contains AraC-type DNA-binding domain [Paenibacillus sp. UNC496MF]|uniref:GyrI-like domain-containing protein n=1 Tax=Paenibacillus sp. UNC496MF TaxID=1502753 RepID=UPI0008E7791C|nr:GyrI-like domain-containing protein [Paenibacillus sp. UNC496MF]SFJ48879.1 Predicted transcriptional regulator YdeE, contains AraC-type DNA-binding domain [Paenibacillus sp. UNC496MF]
MRVRIVERPAMHAAVIRSELGGEGTRRAWRGVQELLNGHPAVANAEYGLVFIPEWQWADGVRELWTGVEITDPGVLPDGVETISIPPRKYAKLTIRGNSGAMEDGYAFLAKWFERTGIARDTDEGSFGFEANRLKPVDPFAISRSEIAWFDYDIYAPIKNGDALAPDPHPRVESIAVAAEPARRIVGVERFVAQGDGENAAEAIPAIREQFHRLSEGWAGAGGRGAEYGLFTYAPPFGPDQSFLYLAGVEIPADDEGPIPAGMTARTIPAGEFAAVTYRGPLAEIGQAWGFFHGSWRGRFGFEAIDDYEYERYGDLYLGADDAESVVELRFPVVRAGRRESSRE